MTTESRSWPVHDVRTAHKQGTSALARRQTACCTTQSRKEQS